MLFFCLTIFVFGSTIKYLVKEVIIMKHTDEAKLIGITHGYWTAIRNKRKIPSLKLAKRIEKIFPEYKVVRLIPDVGKILKEAIK